jgi:DNA-binding LytR/AlgR family response regulator
VIFTTAYSEYAVKGFELEAIDYLVKPVKFERLITALQKAQKAMNSRLTRPPEQEDDFLFLKSGYAMVKIALNEIAYIEGLDDYIKIHTVGRMKPPLLTLMSLKSIMEKLPPDRFMRVHRSFIIPLRKITSIRNKIICLDREKVPLGDKYVDELRHWMSQH